MTGAEQSLDALFSDPAQQKSALLAELANQFGREDAKHVADWAGYTADSAVLEMDSGIAELIERYNWSLEAPAKNPSKEQLKKRRHAFFEAIHPGGLANALQSGFDPRRLDGYYEQWAGYATTLDPIASRVASRYVLPPEHRLALMAQVVSPMAELRPELEAHAEAVGTLVDQMKKESKGGALKVGLKIAASLVGGAIGGTIGSRGASALVGGLFGAASKVPALEESARNTFIAFTGRARQIAHDALRPRFELLLLSLCGGALMRAEGDLRDLGYSIGEPVFWLVQHQDYRPTLQVARDVRERALDWAETLRAAIDTALGEGRATDAMAIAKQSLLHLWADPAKRQIADELDKALVLDFAALFARACDAAADKAWAAGDIKTAVAAYGTFFANCPLSPNTLDAHGEVVEGDPNAGLLSRATLRLLYAHDTARASGPEAEKMIGQALQSLAFYWTGLNYRLYGGDPEHGFLSREAILAEDSLALNFFYDYAVSSELGLNFTAPPMSQDSISNWLAVAYAPEGKTASAWEEINPQDLPSLMGGDDFAEAYARAVAPHPVLATAPTVSFVRGRRKAQRRALFVALIVVLVLLGGIGTGLYFGGTWVYDYFSGPAELSETERSQASIGGWTTVHEDLVSGQPGAMERFRSLGLKVNGFNDMSGETLMHQVAKNNDYELANTLIEWGGDVGVADFSGRTPLHVANSSGSKEVLQVLIAANANVNAVDKQGRGPLAEVAAQDSSEILRVLLRAGADVDAAENNGLTPLHHAAVMGRLENVELLLEGGASPRVTTDRGATPLHDAAANNQEAVVIVLLDNKAKVNARDRDGCTALDLAKKFHHKKMVRLLKKRGGRRKCKR